MTVGSRRTVREAIASGLETAYGVNVYAVYDHMRTGFEGKSPVVRVMTSGSLRPRRAGHIPAPLGSRFRFIIQHFVMHSEDMSGEEQADAEDRLDALEGILAQWVSDNDQVPGSWKSIEQVDYSEPLPVRISSKSYLLEAFEIEVAIDA